MTLPITHDENGRLAKGNVWRFRPGQSGHPARYNYNTLRTKVIEHVEQCHEQEKTLTWAGLAFYVGMTAGGLNRYRNGEVGDKKGAIVQMLEYYVTAMEAALEGKLHETTQGVIFALKNQYADRWQDTRTIEHTGEQASINIVINPDSALATRLQRADTKSVTIDQDTPD